jgi:hypothetical protein
MAPIIGCEAQPDGADYFAAGNASGIAVARFPAVRARAGRIALDHQLRKEQRIRQVRKFVRHSLCGMQMTQRFEIGCGVFANVHEDVLACSVAALMRGARKPRYKI